MDQKNEQKAPLRIKNLAELKRCIRPGTELVATSHSKHPALVGLVRVVTEVQTNAYYSVVRISRLINIRPVITGRDSALISKRHPTIYLRARPSRSLTAEAVMAACFTKWNFIRANTLSSVRRTTWRRMRISEKTMAKSSRKG